MKEYIINHTDLIGWIIGILIMIVMVQTMSYWKDTKYEVIGLWSLAIMGIVGAGHIGQEIMKWILK